MTSARHEPTTRSKGAVPQSKRAAAVVKAAVHPEVTGTLAFQPWAAASRASWSPRLVDLLECQYADGQTGYLVISHAEAENPADLAPAGLGYEEHARNAPKGGGWWSASADSVELQVTAAREVCAKGEESDVDALARETRAQQRRPRNPRGLGGLAIHRSPATRKRSMRGERRSSGRRVCTSPFWEV